MSSLFLIGKVWYAKLRLWDAAAARWRWVKKSTGCEDEPAARLVAGRCELASAEAKKGMLTRERAADLVNEILRLAGLPVAAEVPGLLAEGQRMAEATGLAWKTAQKYAACVTRLRGWAGRDKPMDAWSGAEFARYYDEIRKVLSVGTANDHLRFWRSVYAQAVRLGTVRLNVAAAVKTLRRMPEDKEPLTRQDVAALLRTLRRECPAATRWAWCALTLLGWHTGHRIQDLLWVDAGAFEAVGDLWVLGIQPAKRKRAGGRLVRLPVPRYVARLVRRLGDLRALGRQGDNYNGAVSGSFVAWLRRSGVDVRPVEKAGRVMHRKTFHSFRHAMASRLAAAGVTAEVARLVTDHSSAAVHRKYVHAEVESIAAALRQTRKNEKIVRRPVL